MANAVSNLIKSRYTKTVQGLLQENLIAMDIATMRMFDEGNGRTLNFPRPTYNNVSDYTKYTTHPASDLTYTNEQLVADQTPMISFDYDEVDDIESGYSILDSEASNNAFRIRKHIEGKFFAEYANAGTTGSAVTLAANNVVNTYGNAVATLANDGVDDKNIITVVDPFAMNIIGQGALGNTYQVADESYKRGYKGEFQGTKLYSTPNLTAVVSLAVATNPTADDTVTINGVTWTFKASPAAAGEVDIAGSAAASVDNLVAAINNSAGYAAGAGSASAYFEVSQADRAKLAGITAVDATTSITVTSNAGYRVVSSFLTAPADKFGAVTLYTIVMAKGAISMMLQKAPSLKIQEIPRSLTSVYMTWSKFGIKTFTEGAERMFVVPLTVQAAE